MNLRLFLILLTVNISMVSFAQPCMMMLTTAVNNAMGGGPNGTINLSVNGGTPPYTYVWSNGQTTQNATMLPPGCYSVVVTDAVGCQAMATSCVTNLAGPILYSNSNPVSTFSVVNGGFTPQWVCANQTLQTDGGIMKIYLEPGATMITGGGIDTVYAKTGSTITMTGGIHVIYHEPGVTLNMNGGIPTLYPCASLVFDYSQAPANGCAPVLTCNLSVSLGVSNSIGGGNNGAISTTVSNGTFPFTYAWSGGQTAANLSSLSPGAYSVIVTDANGCMDTAAANIINLAGPTVLSNSNVVSSYQVVNGGFTPQWVCQNDTLYTDGGIMNIYLEAGATMITGGGIDSIFAKSGSTIIMTGGIHRIYHEPGVNLVMNGGIPYLYPCPSLVFNYNQAPANGCVPVPVCNLTASATASNVLCNGQASGTVTVTPVGGTAPFTYAWSPMATNTPILNNLAAGTYTVTVTDVNGCTSQTAVTITEPTPLVATSIATDELLGSDGTATVNVSGGTAPYTYNWSSGGIGATETGLVAGVYTVNITDANGCLEVVEVTVGSQVGITSINSDMSLLIYPNPAHASIELKNSGSLMPNEIQVFSIEGKLIQVLTINTTETITIDVSSWSNGSYILRYMTPFGNQSIPFVKS
jgi:hypothetical protein